MNTYREAWEQREDESPQAFAAFVRYRDMRVGRSINSAYLAATGQQKSNKRASGRFTEWSQRYDWKKRAEAYDAHLERLMRSKFEGEAADAYKRDISAYFERQKRLSAAAGDAAVELLSKAREGLGALDAGTLRPMEIASFFKAAAAIAAAASDSEAVALGVNDLLKDAVNKMAGG